MNVNFCVGCRSWSCHNIRLLNLRHGMRFRFFILIQFRPFLFLSSFLPSNFLLSTRYPSYDSQFLLGQSVRRPRPIRIRISRVGPLISPLSSLCSANELFEVSWNLHECFNSFTPHERYFFYPTYYFPLITRVTTRSSCSDSKRGGPAPLAFASRGQSG